MQYRITVKDTRFSGDKGVRHEVEAPDLVTAIFLAGAQHGGADHPDALLVVKAEVPAGWMEVSLDG